MTAATATATVWRPAEGAAQRGTLVLLPGRGESPAVYQRFGRRLAADGYLVHALDLGPEPGPGAVSAALAEVARDSPAPVVLAGSDTGALHALAAVGAGEGRPDGLLLAALPLDPDAAAPADWEDELAVRTACPAHRGALAADPGFTRGGFGKPVAAGLLNEAPTAPEQLPPVLVLQGGADPLAPAEAVRRFAAGLPSATLVLVEDGRHDVLNDATHRSVAAQIVQWLERLRGGPALPRILTVEEPSR
ncbi:alpha/beta hydrolase [Kitasatospora sp. NPDC057223]|uniref:alpha/beta hydrolase n=1 Tax=Kitasatospora sp. NPDC057223 TaxID=3346055 RepID=UPI00362A87CE